MRAWFEVDLGPEFVVGRQGAEAGGQDGTAHNVLVNVPGIVSLGHMKMVTGNRYE